MSEPLIKPKYTDTALPTDSDTFVLFSTEGQAAGANRLGQVIGAMRFICDIEHSHTGTVKAYHRKTGGSTWRQFYDSGLIAVPAAADVTHLEFLVGQYEEWKVEWVNGGTTQTTFEPDITLSPEVSPSA